MGFINAGHSSKSLSRPFGSLSTPEMGEKETGVSSALKPLGRSRSPPLWRPPRCSELADKCIAIVRPSSSPLWKPVPLSQARSQAVLTPSVMKINGLHGQFAQSTSRLQLAPSSSFVQWTYGTVAEYSTFYSPYRRRPYWKRSTGTS